MSALPPTHTAVRHDHGQRSIRHYRREEAWPTEAPEKGLCFNMDRLMSEDAFESVPFTAAFSSVWRDVWGSIRACCGLNTSNATQLPRSRQELSTSTGNQTAKPPPVYLQPYESRPSNASNTALVFSPEGDEEESRWNAYFASDFSHSSQSLESSERPGLTKNSTPKITQSQSQRQAITVLDIQNPLMVSYLDNVEGETYYCRWEEFISVPGAYEAVERAQWSLEQLENTAHDIRIDQYGVIPEQRWRAEVKRKRMGKGFHKPSFSRVP